MTAFFIQDNMTDGTSKGLLPRTLFFKCLLSSKNKKKKRFLILKKFQKILMQIRKKGVKFKKIFRRKMCQP